MFMIVWEMDMMQTTNCPWPLRIMKSPIKREWKFLTEMYMFIKAISIVLGKN